MIDPIPYATPTHGEYEAGQLRVLSILHYVWGGLAMLLSMVFIFHIVLGILMVKGSPIFNTQRSSVIISSGGGANTASGFPTRALSSNSVNAPPAAFGYFFALIGSCGMVMGMAFGVLTILSGRRIAEHRSRIFSLVMAAINCIWFPFGTALGIFTLIVLSKDSARALYVDQFPPDQLMR